MTDDLDKKNARIKLAKKIGLIATGLFVFYVIVGFWIVPPLLKPKLEEQLSGLLGRKVTIGAIKLNPLVLSSTTSNLTVHDNDGEPFAGFEALYVNVQLSSLFRWAGTVKDVRLSAPFGVLKLLPEGKMNIDDLVAKFSQPAPSPKPDDSLPRAIVARLEVIDGKFTVANLAAAEPIQEVVTPITFTLENLSTLKGRQGEYRFGGVGPIGGTFDVHGTLALNPLKFQGHFSSELTKLSHYWEHIKDLVSFQILNGTARASVDYTMAITDGQLNARLENGAFMLDNFELAAKGEKEVLIAVPTLSVQGLATDLQAQEMVVDRIQTAGAAFKSGLAKDGSVELQRLFQPDIEKLMEMKAARAPATETVDSSPWQVTVNQVEVKDWQFTLDDLTGKNPIRETFALNTFTVDNLSTAKDHQGTYTFDGTGPSGGNYQLNGKLTVAPVWVQGSYAMKDARLDHFWEHVKEHVSFQIVKGSTGASGDFTVARDDGGFNARLENGTYQLNDFELVEKGKQDVLIALPALAVKGIGADVKAREINVASIQTADARIKSWLAADGTFALQKLFLPDLEKLMKKEAADEPEPETTPAQPWQVTLQKMEVTNWGLAFEDRTLTNVAKMSVDDIDVVVENLSTKKGTQATVGVAMQINRAGSVKVNGKAGIAPLQADVKVVIEKIGLESFQPYVDEAVNAQIATGSTSSTGRIRYRGQDAQPQIQIEGDFSIDELEIQDRVQTEDFITLAQFKAGGIALELLPNKLNASEVLIDRPHARVTIDQAGVVNVVNAFAPVEKKAADGQENLLQRLVNFLILQFKGPMPMRVNQVRLAQFTAEFVDASISPTFSTHVEITDGTVKGLSSDPSARADFKLNGSIDKTATIEGAGQMNPMNALQYSKVDVSLKDYALKPVSPYSGKFIGFKINQGTLHTDLKYQVDNDTVKGDNIITIDQLELGEKVDSPDAPNLPIKLGVTLLKDSNGRITLQVPVAGNVKDPQFDFAKAIESSLTGAIEGARQCAVCRHQGHRRVHG